ncbi:MAG: hypothetical protein ACK2U3_10125, partial [Anaerolineales bacterium]
MEDGVGRKSEIIFDIEISPEIFRSYDIRGVADIDPLNPEDIRVIDLTASQAWLIGKAYGSWIKRSGGHRIVIGRDNRRTSLPIAAGFIHGALSTGCEIFDIGLSTTPLLYYSVEKLNCEGGMMVTGSHNPMWSNGLKLSKSGYRTLIGTEIKNLFNTIVNKDFDSGIGTYQEEGILGSYFKDIKQRVNPA